MNKFLWNGFCFVAIVTALIIYACANRGMIEGGERDVTPPKIMAEVPVSFSTNFAAEHIDIYFDEFVQLKDINNQFVISPPMKKKPKTSLRGKYIRVEFQDTLKPGTTYSLDFGTAIADNNEGNLLGYYRYVFSTGSKLDSMELAGKVLDAETQLPVLGAMVLFYANHADSAAILELPSYVAMTDSSGNFRVTNMRDSIYRVLALSTETKSLQYVPRAEGQKVGFVDTLVKTISFPAVQYDTLRPDTVKLAAKKTKKGVEVEVLTHDTVIVRNYTAYGPINLFMTLFEEEDIHLDLDNSSRSERDKLDFTFTIPADNQLNVRFLGLQLLKDPDQKNLFLEERSAGKDTVTLWIKDSLIYKIDSLQAELRYLMTDTTGARVMTTDTVWFVYKDKPKPKGKRKEQDTIPEIKYLGLNTPVGGVMDLNKDILLEFDRPVVPSTLDSVKLFEMVDSVWTPAPFEIKHDSLKIRRYYLKTTWKPETEYRLEIDSASVFSIYGLFNNKLESTFKTKAIEDYGRIFLTFSELEYPLVVQLYQGGSKELKIVDEKYLEEDGEIVFEYLNEGSYMVRVILDRNGNKKWDTGNYMEHLQPEEIKYLPGEFKIKKNFDIEQSYDVSRTYVREDPSKKKDAEDRNRQRN